MSHTLDRQVLAQRFADEWDSAAVPVLGDNQPATTKPAGEFCRFFVEPNAVERRGMGESPEVLRSGFVRVQICIPAGKGSSRAWTLADEAESIFHRFISADYKVRCSDSQIKRRAPLPEDPYYIVTVSTAYESRR